MGETVTINLTPASGYAVDTVTVTNADNSEVTVSGTGNTRTFTMPAGDVTIAASFKPLGYAVTLNGNGGTGTALTTYTYGIGATLPTDWTTADYVFKGWYANAGFTGSAVAAISTTDTGNKTYWAKWADETKPTISVAEPPTDWQKANVNLSVTFGDSVGVTKLYAKTDSGAYAEISGFGTSPYTYTVSTEGEHTYQFKAEDAADNFTESDAVTVKLDTQEPTLTVTGGDTGAASLTLTVASSFGASSGKVTVSGAGSGDVGSSYTVNTKGTYIFTATSAAGKTFAVTTKVHEITFESAGGSAVESQIVANGGKATAPANPTKTGYIFSKWQKSGTDYSFDTAVTADTALTAVWTLDAPMVSLVADNAAPTYNGTAKTPTVTLEGVVGGEDCTVVSTGSAAAGNAGHYKVTAALQGTRGGNYTLQNPNEILVIQPAPVSVSLSDYSYKYDGTAKYATVTALPDVQTTVTYKLAGSTVAAPTEEGIYDIIVELNGRNYRFADGSDGKARRMGVLTIYKERPPELYTVTFEPGAEDAAGTAPTLPPAVKDTVHFLPSNSFLRVGHAFVGWKNGNSIYQPGERFIQPANNNTIFTAQWEAASYDIGGVVDQDGKPVANVRVVLMRGAEQVAETVTNQIGEYRFDSVLPGLYNLVAIKPSPDGVGDIIMTIMVEVKAADVEQANITLPSGKTNSIVEVAPGTPKIIVGNLDQTFKSTEGGDYTPEDKEVVNKGGTVEIKFSAEEKQKDEITVDAEEITKQAGGKKIGMYLALDVQKTVTQSPVDGGVSSNNPITETSVLLESVIPLPSDLQGKESYTVYRMHEGVVDSLTTDTDSGERIEISEDKTTLTLYAQKYSTYAIAYTEKSSGGGGGDDGDGGGGWNPDPIKPEQPAPIVPAPGTDAPKPAQPGITQPDNPNADGTDKDNGGDGDKGNDKNEQPNDGGNNDAQKDEIRDALEDAINNLPDTLPDEQRQEYIDRLTEIADEAIEALDGTNDPGEAKRIAQQAQKDMKNIVTEALALANGKAKPFVLASALLALAAVLLAVFALLKRKDKRRGIFSAIFAAFAVVAFLLTTGWSGFALANWWTLVVAALTVCAAMGVFIGYSKEEQPQTK